MSDDEDIVLLTLPRGERGEVRVSRSRYAGNTFTKFHFWFPGKDGELHPGRQVVTIRDHELEDVIDALSRIAAKIGAQSPRSSSRSQTRRAAGAAPPAEMTDEERAKDEALF